MFGVKPRKVVKRLRRLANQIEDGDVIVSKMSEKSRLRPNEFEEGRLRLEFARK